MTEVDINFFTFNEIFPILERRQYYSFTNKIPPKELIEKILKQAIFATPTKNDQYTFKVKVFGPDYTKEKIEALSHTACIDNAAISNDLKERFTKLYQSHIQSPQQEMYNLVKQEYENSEKSRGGDRICFNTQICAPWILRFDIVSKFWRDGHEMVEVERDGKKYSDFEINDRPQIGIGMYAINVANIAKHHGLDSSFTACINFPKYNTQLFEGKNSKEVPFVLSLGYGKHRKGRAPEKRKILPEDLVTFV